MTLIWMLLFTLMLMALIALLFSLRRRFKHVDDRKAVAMPVDHLEPEARKLKELLVGETGYVIFTVVKVNQRGAVFLSTDDDVKVESEPSFSRVFVRREKGGFVVKLKEDDKFTPRPLPTFGRYEPVIAIEFEDNASLKHLEER